MEAPGCSEILVPVCSIPDTQILYIMKLWDSSASDSKILKNAFNLSLPAVTGQPGSESECNLVDSLLYDIRSGFQQSKGLNGSSRDLRVSTASSQLSSLLEQSEWISETLWK